MSFQPVSYTPATYDPYQYATSNPFAAPTPPPAAAAPAANKQAVAPPTYAYSGAGPNIGAPSTTSYGTAPSTASITAQPIGGAVTGGATDKGGGTTYTNYGSPTGAFAALSPEQYAQVPAFLKTDTGAPRYAFGTGMAHGTFITGDSTDPNDPAAGGAKPEAVTVHDPPGKGNAFASVTPLTAPASGGGDAKRMGELFSAIGDFLSGDSESGPGEGGMGEDGMMPGRFAMGTPRYAFGTNPDTSSTDPYLQEVRAMRTGTQYANLNPYNVNFSFQPPSQQTDYYKGVQDVYGIPVADQQAEQQQYQLGGVSRTGFGAYHPWQLGL